MTLLSMAPISVSATWSATEMSVMIREIGSPVCGTSEVCALPSAVMPKGDLTTSSFNCLRVRNFLFTPFSNNPLMLSAFAKM